jgi:hypothetical protein
MWRLVALVRTDVSEERIAYIFMVTRISEHGKVKLKLYLCLTKHYTRNMYGGNSCRDPHVFLPQH